MTSEQKISRMYRHFGESQSGKKCKDCSNLIKVERGNHRVSKCLVYGDTFQKQVIGNKAIMLAEC